VVSDRKPRVQRDDVVRLRTSAGQFEARVISVIQFVLARPPDQRKRKQSLHRYRLGLCRQRELDGPGLDKCRTAVLRSWFGLAQFFPSASPMLFWGAAIATVLIALAMGIAVLSSHLDRSLPERIVRFGRQLFVSSEAAADLEPAAEQLGASADNPALDETGLRPDEVERLRKLIPQWPGATALARPEVARALRLTEDQRQRIHRIVERTTAAEPRQKAHQAARQEALGILTDTQRARWQALTSPANQH